MATVPFDPLVYLTPPARSFWRWSYSGEAAAWRYGQTIAFRLELAQILRGLCEEGLPPLSLVLLVLAACRDSLKEALADHDNLLNLGASVGDPPMDQLKRLVDGLMRISGLPREMRHPIEAKAGLVRFLFETAAPRTTPSEAKSICESVHLVGADEMHGLGSRSQGHCPGLGSLLAGMDRFDKETFTLRQATGLDCLLRPAEIEPLLGEQARSLISRLQEDQQFQGLVRLARALMAVVHVPRPLSDPEDLPMGGFSDISNRGPLDRLLVSELANDSLTLAVRVALNEALYLRRENPRKTPPHSRALLLDVGIRLWGVPRVFATAAAMAIAANADRHTSVAIFRAKRDRIVAANLTTRAGLVEHLAALEAEVHPGLALDRFMSKAREKNADADCVIVTSSEAAADRGFQQSLARHGKVGLYLATVSRDGEFRLLREGPHARKVICEARLALEDLLQPRPVPTVPLVDPDRNQKLPAIFSEKPFPLRLPCRTFAARSSWTVPGCGVFEITSDRRLLLWDSSRCGPRQIADFVPGGAHVSSHDPKLRDGTTRAVLGQTSELKRRILLAEVDTGKTKIVDLDIERGRSVGFGPGGLLFGIGRRDALVFSPITGSPIGRIELGKAFDSNAAVNHQLGRFLSETGTNAWYALAYDGSQAKWEKVFDPRTHGGVELIAMFDWLGHEGPVAVTKRGELYFPDERGVRPLINVADKPIRVAEVSACGGWLRIDREGNKAGSSMEYIEVATGTGKSSWSDMRSFQAGCYISSYNGAIRNNFIGMRASSREGLVLVSKKGSSWRIALEGGKIKLQPAVSRVDEPICRFDRQFPQNRGSYALRAGTWKEAGQACFDTRGLLHLRSEDVSLPEITLVLTDEEIAGWCSDGRLWGNRYFAGDRALADPREIFDEVIQTFVDHVT